MFVVTLSSLET